MMDEYYANQVCLLHFSSYNRQRGSRIGALAAGIGRVALPFAKKTFYQQQYHVEKNAQTKYCISIGCDHEPKITSTSSKKALSKTIRKQNGGRKKRVPKSGRKNQNPLLNENVCFDLFWFTTML